MDFKILGPLSGLETIAQGKGIREIVRLQRTHGKGKWLKRKGMAWIKLPGQPPRLAELHWYEAHGVGKKEFKIKRLLPGEAP